MTDVDCFWVDSSRVLYEYPHNNNTSELLSQVLWTLVFTSSWLLAEPGLHSPLRQVLLFWKHRYDNSGTVRLMPGWVDCFVYGMGQYAYTVWQPARHKSAPQLCVQLILTQWSTDWMWLTARPKGLWRLSDFTSHWRCPLGIPMFATSISKTTFCCIKNERHIISLQGFSVFISTACFCLILGN